MTRSYMWYECDMTYSYRTWMWHDSFIWNMNVTWWIHTCDTTDTSYIWHSYIQPYMPFIYTVSLTHIYIHVWRIDIYVHIFWRIDIYVHVYVIYIYSIIHVRLTYRHVRHSYIQYHWHIYTYVWRIDIYVIHIYSITDTYTHTSDV